MSERYFIVKVEGFTHRLLFIDYQCLDGYGRENIPKKYYRFVLNSISMYLYKGVALPTIPEVEMYEDV